MLIDEIIVADAEQLDFDNLRIVFGALRQYFDIQLLELLNSMAYFLNEFWSDYMECKRALSFIDDAKSTNCINRTSLEEGKVANLRRLGSLSAT